MKAAERETAGIEVRRGFYGAIGAGMVAAAGLVIIAFLFPHKTAARTVTSSTTAGGCVGCGQPSAAKVYG